MSDQQQPAEGEAPKEEASPEPKAPADAPSPD